MSRRAASSSAATPRRRVLIASVVVWVVILVGAYFAWQWLVGMDALRRSEVYAEAVARAGSHPQVVAALGQPVEPGWWVRGRVVVDGPGGEGRLALPLAGPDGRGRLAAEARRQGGIWRFDRLEVTLADGTVVDLLAAPPPQDDPGAIVSAAAVHRGSRRAAVRSLALVAPAASRCRPAPSPTTAPGLAIRPAPPTPWHDVRIEWRS
jgi:hypothetical protein